MLPQKNKIKRKEFIQLPKRSTIFSNENVSIKVFYSGTKTEDKFSVIVSKNSENKSTKRNKLKRRIYSIIKKNHNFEKGRSIVIYTKKGASSVSFRQLEREIINTLKKVKYIKR